MTDKEMLELAAKAGGIQYEFFPNQFRDASGAFVDAADGSGTFVVGNLVWNPLTDDGDALRLAVKLGFSVNIHLCDEDGYSSVSVWGKSQHRKNAFEGDLCKAARYAITSAAAEIGKAMP